MSQYLQNTDADFFDYSDAANLFLRDEPDEDEEEEEEEPEDDEEDDDDEEEDEDENGDDGYSE